MYMKLKLSEVKFRDRIHVFSVQIDFFYIQQVFRDKFLTVVYGIEIMDRIRYSKYLKTL